MSNISNALAWAVIVKTIFNVCRCAVVLCWRRTQAARFAVREHTNDKVALSILIPLYQEAAISDRIAHTAYQLATEAPQNVQVILICSTREGTDEHSTIGSLRRSLNLLTPPPNIVVLESDGTDRCKADQLNQGLMHVDTHITSAAKYHWIGVYDADSKPEPGAIREVLTRASTGSARVMQQPPLYVGRWERFHAGYRRLFVDAFCLSRALYSHIFSFKESFGYLLSGGRFDFRLHHLTGHGYFIERALLRELGDFSPPSCDTALGYRASLADQHIQLLAGYDISEVPDTVNAIWRQGLVWYHGCDRYLLEYQNARRSNTLRKSRGRSVFMLAQVAMTNAAWAILPVFWASCLTLAVVEHQSLSLWMWATIIWVLFRCVAWCHMLTVRNATRASIGWARGILVPFFSLVSVPACCVPPLTFYRLRSTRRPVPLQKTPRAG